jgi:hypothetical protein
MNQSSRPSCANLFVWSHSTDLVVAATRQPAGAPLSGLYGLIARRGGVTGTAGTIPTAASRSCPFCWGKTLMAPLFMERFVGQMHVVLPQT